MHEQLFKNSFAKGIFKKPRFLTHGVSLSLSHALQAKAKEGKNFQNYDFNMFCMSKNRRLL